MRFPFFNNVKPWSRNVKKKYSMDFVASFCLTVAFYKWQNITIL
ncbi:Hypothetical protein I595_284 [Croceitalea dokdonensis DOKDO 023]|uniref:Uncharacterized protein n=1 Tax=Croceitalea dokdonensis DOKDO 023 TaxID=1300341 RepID=A0A0N8H4H4_9FLAO|nr:Hypothetical protein I595_284 [Croceitalea dokdonensis DOKDO 023]